MVVRVDTKCGNRGYMMKQCILCGKMTDGSVGKAGIKWSIICQPCKDKADNGLQASLEGQSKVCRRLQDNFDMMLSEKEEIGKITENLVQRDKMSESILIDLAHTISIAGDTYKETAMGRVWTVTE